MKSKITYENVVETIQGLIASGIKPTVRVVADRLGGGSMSTVHKYFKQYKEGMQTDLEYSVSDGLFSALKREIATAIEEALQVVGSAEKENENAMADVLQENERLEKELHGWKQQVSEYEKSLAVETGLLRSLQDEFRQLKDKLEEKDRAIGERDFRLETLNAELNTVKAQALSMSEVLEIYRKQIADDLKPKKAPVKSSEVAKSQKAANKGKTPSTSEQVTA